MKPLASGVRIARVITTSSAFLDVLTIALAGAGMRFGGVAYIEDSPEEPGVMCLRMELSRSPAIVKVGYGTIENNW